MAQASYLFSPVRDDIIKAALRKVILESGETPGAQAVSDANFALNSLVAELQATGLHLWTETEGVLFLQPNQIKYSLGGTNADQACLDANWVGPTLASAPPSGATSIQLSSIAGISSGDNIGVTLSTNALFWTTVNGAPSGATVNLTAPLPAPASMGAYVIDYAPLSKMPRPLRVIDARRYYIQSTIETPLIREARLDYRDMPNKNSTGTISTFFYDPQLVTGLVWAWPAPPDSLSAMKFTFLMSIGDFLNSSDTPDFPQEWTNMLVWGLAEELGPEYGIGQFRMGTIAAKSKKSLEIVQGWDREPESLYMGVNFEQSSR
jgi:hypothetical protein